MEPPTPPLWNPALFHFSDISHLQVAAQEAGLLFLNYSSFVFWTNSLAQQEKLH